MRMTFVRTSLLVPVQRHLENEVTPLLFPGSAFNNLQAGTHSISIEFYSAPSRAQLQTITLFCCGYLLD
jgi:hypothetical protein